MTTDNVQLEVQNVNQADGKTYYKPVILKVGGTSQYRDTEFFFGNVEGYWDSSHAKGNGLIVNQWVKVALSTKEKPDGPNTKPGAIYRDIVQVRLATGEEMAEAKASQGITEQNHTARPAPVRDDGQEVYRTKEELRWTEALHMATRVNHTDILETAPFFMNWANYFYDLLVVGPQATESHGDEKFDAEPPIDDLPF